MFQFFFKEKFDVLSHVRKMQIQLVLFALIIYTIFKEDNTPVICIHGPHLRGKPWNSRGKVLDNYFFIVPTVPRKCGGYNIGTLTLLGFSVVRVRQSAGLLPSACSHRAGLIPGLWKVKIIIPPIPVGGGAVDTNDWCINGTYRRCCSSTK